MNDSIGNLEEMVLLLVMTLEPEAYAISLANEYKKIKKKSISTPAIHTVLKRLVSKGFLSSRAGEGTPERGGRSKVYYSLTKEGYAVIKEVQIQREQLWANAEKPQFT